jgi:hypothetical protein
MKKERHNFNRNLHLELIPDSDELRPNFSYIYFSNGFIYATDAHKIIKVKISEVSDFDNEEIELLNGNAIHPAFYSKILCLPKVKIEKEGIRIIVDAFNSYVFEFMRNPADITEMCEKVFTNAITKAKGKISVHEIGLNADFLHDICSAMGFSSYMGIKLTFSKQSDAILIKSKDYDRKESIALLMPIMINE